MAIVGLDVLLVFRGLFEPLDEPFGVLAHVVRVFARYFDIPTPARLPSKVDHRGPEGRPSLPCVHEGTCLVADLAPGELPERTVEGHAGGNGEGKLGRLVIVRDTRGSLLPPVVLVQTKGWDGSASGVEIWNLFSFEIHAAEHVLHAFIDGESCIAPPLRFKGAIETRVIQRLRVGL